VFPGGREKSDIYKENTNLNANAVSEVCVSAVYDLPSMFFYFFLFRNYKKNIANEKENYNLIRDKAATNEFFWYVHSVFAR